MRTVVIVGGVAGGMSAAARLRRLEADARIVVVEQGEQVSFANCGLPYYVGGEIPERGSLLLHTPATLADTLGIEVLVRTEALRIDRLEQTITVRGPGGEETLHYDALVLAPGGYAVRPPIPGIDHPRVATLRTVPDADQIRAWIGGGAKRAVVLGAGFIGLEAAEALHRAGLAVSIVEAAPQVLPVIDPELASLVTDELRAHGVEVCVGRSASRIEDVGGRARVVLDTGGSVLADLVVLSVGVRPRSELATAAGLALTDGGAILVDDQQRTSDPHIWAVGDACASTHAVTGAVGPVALATGANRGGRVAADSIVGRAGRAAPHPMGTAVVRVFDLIVAMTGAARRALAPGSFHTARVHAGHHAGYYPGAETMHLLMHFGADGTILGAQGVGRAGVDKRIDVIATAMRAGLSADDLVDLDLCYAPPFGSAKDPVLMLGMIADNVRSGVLVQADPVAGVDAQAAFVLDVRNPDEYAEGHVDGATLIPQPQVAESVERIRELADGRPIVVHCASGFRSYLAHRTLAGAGLASANLSGGFHTLSRVQPQLVRGESVLTA